MKSKLYDEYWVHCPDCGGYGQVLPMDYPPELSRDCKYACDTLDGRAKAFEVIKMSYERELERRGKG